MELFKDSTTYFETADSLEDEVTMWYIAASLIKKETIKRTLKNPCGGLGAQSGDNIQNTPLSFLDICSGPGNFANYVSLLNPEINITCLDSNPEYTQIGSQIFSSFQFITADILKYKTQTEFDIIGLSSAYHHIIDKQKVNFLKKTGQLLKKNGYIFMCEHFLPEYNSPQEKQEAIDTYYQFLINYSIQNHTPESTIQKLHEVKGIEKAGRDEFKNSYSIFCKHLKQSNLRVVQKIPVLMNPEHKTSGSFVLILKKNP